MKTKEQVLALYKQKLANWQRREINVIDLRKLDINSVMIIHYRLHRANKTKSKELTKELLEFLKQAEIATTEEILAAVKISYPALNRRLQELRRHGIIRRESRLYYLATPRLTELLDSYMKHLMAL